MHILDLSVFIIYMAAVLGIGFYFLKRNKNADDYFVGGRKMGTVHVGLSVVATDVGGGFSIGLGGLGFIMGLSGSWMLFTGLIGAWLSAVILIPKVAKLGISQKWLTFPQLFKHYYGAKVALLAGIISALGYVGFTSSQLLAGAKLASASFEGLNLNTALLIMGVIAVVYTVMGGIKAVIYTDTFQWIILMAGLIFIGIPMSYYAIGGMESIRAHVGPEMLSLGNISWQTALNWAVTIIPIWFVGMTLYQRIYSTRSPQHAQRAWFLAGLFEWPVMAFMGVTLGLFARVAFEQDMFAYMGYGAGTVMDPEMGLPVLLRTILPIGLMGLMMSAYFSAILSTADSCLMAASGNIQTDILRQNSRGNDTAGGILRSAQIITLIIGIFSLILAWQMEEVLELMLYSYAFMVSGLFVPVLGALYWRRSSSIGALCAMISGGATTLLLIFSGINLPLGLDPIIFGIIASVLCLILFSLLFPKCEMAQTEDVI